MHGWRPAAVSLSPVTWPRLLMPVPIRSIEEVDEVGSGARANQLSLQEELAELLQRVSRPLAPSTPAMPGMAPSTQLRISGLSSCK